MDIKSSLGQLQHEFRVVQGEDTKDVTYSSHQAFADEPAATRAFDQSVLKLLHVDGWSGLSSVTADFRLHDQQGEPKPNDQPVVGDFILIKLPGPMPENWVRVTHIGITPTRVEFTVKPSHDPRSAPTEVIDHFFDQQASSTFRVERTGNQVSAWEIGSNESINNQQPQAGDRAAVNTFIAEGGWLFYQKIQWKALTDYLVHLS